MMGLTLEQVLAVGQSSQQAANSRSLSSDLFERNRNVTGVTAWRINHGRLRNRT